MYQVIGHKTSAVDLYVFGPPESLFFTSKQGIFRWNDLLGSF